MFVRVKNKSTKDKYRKSVQIVHNFREEGKVRQKILKHIGVAYSEKHLKELMLLGESIKEDLEIGNQTTIFKTEEILKDIDKTTTSLKREGDKYSDEDYQVDIRSLEEEARVTTGIHDIYGKLFDELKLKSIFSNPARNAADVERFKNIVMARIANPASKRESVDRLEKDFGVGIDLDKIYRMMDKLDAKAIEKLNKLSYDKTKCLFPEKIDVIYFDATTIYFESFTEDIGEDGIRKNGYSKDLKFNQPQVLLALMVTKEGLPIGYEAFSGDTYEGHTLIPSLKKLQERYNIDKAVYVADSGMFNEKNLKELEKLEEHGFNYIVGARIKNMSKKVKEDILDKNGYTELNEEISVKEIELENGRKLILTYSTKRAKKDKLDRLKGIEKIRKKLSKNKSLKSQLSNQGYQKYLKIEDSEGKEASKEIQIKLDEEKIKADAVWDGLKGVIVNKECDLSNEEILHQYKQLWQVEESFRITKHDLKIRPVYHWKPSRVRAHIAIAFAAFMLVRHLEYRVKLQYKKLSPEYIKKLLTDVQISIVYSKEKKIKYAIPSTMNQETMKIYRLMGVSRKTTPYIIKKY